MHIITGGKAYADIDVLACALAYGELLNLIGCPAEAVMTGRLNQTIPASIRRWPLKYYTALLHDPEMCEYILVDLSDPKHKEDFVLLSRVVAVFDHHYGYEEFWSAKLAASSIHIAAVGACATLIWEEFKHAGLQSAISTVNANLLYTAIFANTLDFKSHMTAERDVQAFKELSEHVHLPTDWKAHYYQEIAAEFVLDLSAEVEKDTKRIDFQASTFYFGQIEVWNAQKLVKDFVENFKPQNPQAEWLVNIASIEEGCSYFYTNSQRLSEEMQRIAAPSMLDLHIQMAPRLWQRKEVLRELQKKSSKIRQDVDLFCPEQIPTGQV